MNQVLTGLNSNDTTTYNGAVAHSTTGVKLLDYFAECGSYQWRTQEAVNASMASIFAEDKVQAFKVMLYNRMVTRKVKGFVATESLQKGQGLRDEFAKSLKWLEANDPQFLYKNLYLIPQIGCWRDLWYYSPVTKVNHFVNPKEVYKLVKKGMKVEFHRHLLAKYLPKIRSASNVKNDRHRALNAWAKGLCEFLGWTEREYRIFKSNPDNTAHLWQRLACNDQWSDIDFNTISGKALFNLVKGKSLDKHGIKTNYEKWIMSKPVANFTGFVHELFIQAAKPGRDVAQTHTYNAQFNKLLENAINDVSPELLESGVLCALDTSGSMGSFGYYSGKARSYQPLDICLGLGIYFSSLLRGDFKDYVAMFDDTSRLLKVPGNFCQKVDQLHNHMNAMGSTNFQSLIDMLVKFRKNNPEVPLSDYPKTLLVVSDMMFDSSGRYNNHKTALAKLASVGLTGMTFVWWNVNGYQKSYENKANDTGVVLVSGFDGSILTSVLKGTQLVKDEVTGELRQTTPLEVMNECLNQEILNKVKL